MDTRCADTIVAVSAGRIAKSSFLTQNMGTSLDDNKSITESRWAGKRLLWINYWTSRRSITGQNPNSHSHLPRPNLKHPTSPLQRPPRPTPDNRGDVLVRT